MSDVQPAYDAAAAWAEIEAKQTARARLAEEALPPNRLGLLETTLLADVPQKP